MLKRLRIAPSVLPGTCQRSSSTPCTLSCVLASAARLSHHMGYSSSCLNGVHRHCNLHYRRCWALGQCAQTIILADRTRTPSRRNSSYIACSHSSVPLSNHLTVPVFGSIMHPKCVHSFML